MHVKFNSLEDDPERGRIEISAVGPWVETILWEVPLMACLSETYFRTTDTDWTHDGQERTSSSSIVQNPRAHSSNIPVTAEIAYNKAKRLLQADIQFSEFGTRRRRSYYIQDLVVRTLIQASRDFPDKGKVVGTSNVLHAHRCIVLT